MSRLKGFRPLAISVAVGLVFAGGHAVAADMSASPNMQATESNPADSRQDAEVAGFSALDQDADERISREEAAERPALSDRFDQYDTNADDAIDRDEFSAFEAEVQDGTTGDVGAPVIDTGGTDRPAEAEMASFIELDTDGDAVINRDEAKALPLLDARFEEFDVDGNGSLDEAEFGAFEARAGVQSAEDSAGASVLPEPRGTGTGPGTMQP